MAVVFGLIWRPIVAVFKLLVWMLSATSLYLRKCTTHLTRLDSTRFGVYGSRYATTSRSSNMATVGEGADDKLVEKIAKNVVQNVKTKEVRHMSFQKKKKKLFFLYHCISLLNFLRAWSCLLLYIPRITNSDTVVS